MVIFIEWMTRMKPRETTSLIPFHHSRERVPQQFFPAPRPVLTPEFRGFTKGQVFFPSLASLPSFQPHTQAGTVKEKGKRNLPASFSGLCNPHQPAPGVIYLPLPWLTIQRTIHCAIASDSSLSSLLPGITYSTELRQLQGHPNVLTLSSQDLSVV